MKKIILLTGIIVMTYAASSFAAALGFSASIPSGITGFNVSKNVVIGYDSGTTLGAGAAYYSIGTKHTSGSKKFGAISTDTGMYALDNSSITTVFVVTDLPTLPSAAGAAVSGWTSM